MPLVAAIVLVKGKLNDSNYQEYLDLKKDWDTKLVNEYK